jgi:prepilin-type N-terminal cleavage/methylation domain-containing protein
MMCNGNMENSRTMKLMTDKGFSLIEVLIALAITGFVTAAVFQTFRNQHESYMAQDDVTNIQQNARASIDEITRQVRMTGYGVPAEYPSIAAGNTNPDTITLIYQTADCSVSLSTAMAQVSSALECAAGVSCFTENNEAFIWEADSIKGEFFVMTQVETGANRIQHGLSPLTRKYGAGSAILSLSRVKYYVDKTTDNAHPRLMVKIGNQPAHIYADDVSDLQFRYRMRDGSVVDAPALATDVREVMITLTGRSAAKNPDNTANPYRVRTYASSASLRNMGL